MDELGIEYVFTPPYSPHFNAIEEVWAMSKRIIKKNRYQAIMNGKQYDLKKMVLESFGHINVLSISKCIHRALSHLIVNKT